MAYCRMSDEDSDAYVYIDSSDTTIYCRIRIRPGVFETREFIFRKDALQYLRDKSSSGCRIPEPALVRLEEEIDYYGDEILCPYSCGAKKIWMESLKDKIVCQHCRLINPEEYFEKLKADGSNRESCKRKWDKIVPAEFTCRSDAINHINDHLAAEHRVEEGALKRLEDEIRRLGDAVVEDVTPMKARYCKSNGI